MASAKYRERGRPVFDSIMTMVGTWVTFKSDIQTGVDPSAANPVPCMKVDSSGKWLYKDTTKMVMGIMKARG
jgi:hypothetical protein